jgi:spore coat protein SA
MKKVAIIAPDTLPMPPTKGGAIQVSIEEVCKRLKGYDLHVFSKASDNAPQSEIINGVQHHRIKLSEFEKAIIMLTHFKPDYYPYIHKMIPLLKSLDPDIVHVHGRPWYIPFIKKSLKQAKIILHEQNHNLIDMLPIKQAKKIVDIIDAYVGISQFTVNYEIGKNFPEALEKSRVIHNGVDLKVFRPMWEKKAKVQELRKKYKVNSEKAVLFAGRLSETKGIQHLLSAMKLVIKDLPKAKLIIAGGSLHGSNKATQFTRELQDRAKEIDGNVIFAGFVPHSKMQEVFLLADVFVAPSVWDEALGVVFLEASATGLPIISTQRGGIPECVKDGKTGFLLKDPSNIKEMAKKITRLLENPLERKTLGERGQNFIEENFSWEKAAEKVKILYNSLLP